MKSELTHEFQLKHFQIGRLNLSSKLALKNDTDGSIHFSVVPWQQSAKFGICLTFARAAAVLVAGDYLIQNSHGLLENIITYSALCVSVTDMLYAGPARFQRLKAPKAIRDIEPTESIKITRQEHDELKNSLTTQWHIHSFIFNNCNKKAKSKFDQVKRDIIEKRKHQQLIYP
jgi:hypothetical protein